VSNFGFRAEEDLEHRGPGDIVYSAIQVADAKNLDQVQVVLMEELEDIPNEYLLLGSSYPDTTVYKEDGSAIFAYQWDDQWLSLNGFPAYVADIHHYQVNEDSTAADYAFTRIHIPALLNPGTEQEKNIMMSFIFDEDFEHELEGILREPYGEEIMIPSKERIDLQPGDRVQLLYEIFDAQTNEAFFTPGDAAIIDINNGNEDLLLDHTHLEAGNYHLGFVLMDHSQNDTIIYDPQVHQIQQTVNTLDLEATVAIRLSPNPTSDKVLLNLETPGKVQFVLYDTYGQELEARQINGNSDVIIDLKSRPAGTYWLKLQMDNRMTTKKIIKR
jgi:hypothetical protein